MKISFPEFTISTDVFNYIGSADYLFLLHGFTGSSKDWQPVARRLSSRFNIVGIDLIGHGRSDSPEELPLYSAAAISLQIEIVIRQFTKEKVIVCGYSMGARAALTHTVNFPSSVKGLILESGTAGIKNEPDRIARVSGDENHIGYLLDHSMEEFVEYWMNMPIFNTQIRFSKERRKDLKEAKILNDKLGLINCLKGFGTGVMPSYWNNLEDIKAKTLLISGGLDSKFTGINHEMVQKIPSSEHIVIPSSGHNTHLEEPVKFVPAVNNFLSAF